METAEMIKNNGKKVNPIENKATLFIVDHDMEYRNFLKYLLEAEFGEKMDIKMFINGESAMDEIKLKGARPNVILMDYLGNRHLNLNTVKHVVDDISRISPDTGIIMLSHKEYKEQAIKALGYGAHDYVLKDYSSYKDVLTSVRKALNPPLL